MVSAAQVISPQKASKYKRELTHELPNDKDIREQIVKHQAWLVAASARVFPMQAHDSDADHHDRVDQESLDNAHWKSAQGGFLTTLHGDVEERLPQAIKFTRVRERTKLLDACVLPEQVRRLCRRAGVSRHQTNGRGRRTSSEDSVPQAFKHVCDLYLFKLCKEISRPCKHLRIKIFTEDILREALRSSHLNLIGSYRMRQAMGQSMKHYRNKTGDERWRGTEEEIYHERNTNAGPCLTFPRSSFLQLVRLYLAEQASFENPLKPSTGVIDCIQLLLESILIDALEKARYMVRQTTPKQGSRSIPRATLLGRDLKTVLVILASSNPILQGRLRTLGNPTLSRRRRPSRVTLCGSAHAKVKAKVKGKAPARARALARAKKT